MAQYEHPGDDLSSAFPEHAKNLPSILIDPIIAAEPQIIPLQNDAL